MSKLLRIGVTDNSMSGRALCIFGCIFLCSGCIYNAELMPAVVYDYGGSSSSAGEPLHPVPVSGEGTVDVVGGVPWSWYPPAGAERGWTAIIIHHSGTDEGNTAIFDKWHREGNHWEGVGYDFVIGNGTDSGDGEVEVTFRWRDQIQGAHCGGTARNWANEEGIGICLVGDFNRSSPTARQMQSLVQLVRFLQQRYRIPTSRIFGHGSTPGARVTDCPGRNFSLWRLKRML